MKVNLGCGMDYKEGYINIDIELKANPDKVVDIEKGLPFKDNSINEILAYNVLEHITNYDYVLTEIYRISKPNAIIKIIVPHFSSTGAYLDDHKRFYSTKSLHKYKKQKYNTNGFIENELFKVKKIKIIFPKGLNILNYIGRVFNLSNKLQTIYEDTILKNIFVSNFIYFELRVVK